MASCLVWMDRCALLQSGAPRLTGWLRVVPRQVTLESERNREAVLRELAQADANVHVLKTRVEDANCERESLSHRLQLEANHTVELQALIEQLRCARARHQSRASSSFRIRGRAVFSADFWRVAWSR